MKVDLQHKKNRREALAVLGRGTVLSLFAGAGFIAGRERKAEKPEQAVPALMIVWSEKDKQDNKKNAVRNSSLVQKACHAAGLEFRMYRADADLFQCEQWERDMFNAACEFGTPSIAIVDHNGIGECYPIPTTVDSLIRVIKGASK
jgi:hypothetical protein